MPLPPDVYVQKQNISYQSDSWGWSIRVAIGQYEMPGVVKRLRKEVMPLVSSAIIEKTGKYNLKSFDKKI